MWEVNGFSRGFYGMCNSVLERGVSPSQGTRNSDTHPFETIPQYVTHEFDFKQTCQEKHPA